MQHYMLPSEIKTKVIEPTRQGLTVSPVEHHYQHHHQLSGIQQTNYWNRPTFTPKLDLKKSLLCSNIVIFQNEMTFSYNKQTL